jgi:hypothetical protein
MDHGKVIPSIRKTGSYTLPASGKPMSHVENIARGLLSANFMIEQMKTEIAIWLSACSSKPITYQHDQVHSDKIGHIVQIVSNGPPAVVSSFSHRILSI